MFQIYRSHYCFLVPKFDHYYDFMLLLHLFSSMRVIKIAVNKLCVMTMSDVLFIAPIENT